MIKIGEKKKIYIEIYPEPYLSYINYDDKMIGIK